MVPAGSDQPVPVFVPSAVHHRRLVGVDRRQNLQGRKSDRVQVEQVGLVVLFYVTWLYTTA